MNELIQNILKSNLSDKDKLTLIDMCSKNNQETKVYTQAVEHQKHREKQYKQLGFFDLKEVPKSVEYKIFNINPNIK